VGLSFTAAYIIYFRFLNPSADNAENWLLGISPEGIGTMGTILNLVSAYGVSMFTKDAPEEVQEIVENIRLPGEVKSIAS
jgi:cation/acetate symporter